MVCGVSLSCCVSRSSVVWILERRSIAGDVIGFVLSVDGGAGIYISGDTVWFSGVTGVAEHFNIR
jgi:hypothetical protein